MHHERHIKDYYADTERIKLYWMRNLLIVASLVWLGYVVANGTSGLHVASTWLCLILSLLVYYIAYMSIRQPTIFAVGGHDQTINSPAASAYEEEDLLSVPSATAVMPAKYAKSGLTHREISNYVPPVA